jgi:hypothetical protein
VKKGRGTANVSAPRAEVVHAVGRNASQPAVAGSSQVIREKRYTNF